MRQAKFTNKIHVLKIFDGQQTDSAESLESDVIDLNTIQTRGIFALDIKVTGDGTANVFYKVSGPSVSGWDFIKPSGATNIATGLTKTSGPNSDGHDYFTFEPELARFLKICVEETSLSSSGYEPVTVTAYLIVQ